MYGDLVDLFQLLYSILSFATSFKDLWANWTINLDLYRRALIIIHNLKKYLLEFVVMAL